MNYFVIANKEDVLAEMEVEGDLDSMYCAGLNEAGVSPKNLKNAVVFDSLAEVAECKKIVETKFPDEQFKVYELVFTPTEV